MLPRSRRISTALFEEIMKKGRNVHSDHLTLRYNKADTPLVSRFSVAVPKKVAPKAVDRNTIKRKVSAILEQELPSLPKGYRGIFFGKKGSLDLTFQDYEAEIEYLLQKMIQ